MVAGRLAFAAGALVALTACAGPVEYACTVTYDAGATLEPWGDGRMSCGQFRRDGVSVLVAEEAACREASGPRDGIEPACRCVLGDRHGCEPR